MMMNEGAVTKSTMTRRDTSTEEEQVIHTEIIKVERTRSSSDEMKIASSVITVSDDIVKLREELASTRESYNESMKRFQEFQSMSCSDRLELEQLRKVLLDNDNNNDLKEWYEQLSALIKEKVEVEMRHQETLSRLRDVSGLLLKVQNENNDLTQKICKLSVPGPGNDGARMTSDSVNELKEQINKWEALYFESSEMGIKTITDLENKLRKVEQENARLEQERNDALLSKTINSHNNNMNQDCINDVDLVAWIDRIEQLEHRVKRRDETIAKLRQQLYLTSRLQASNNNNKNNKNNEFLDGGGFKFLDPFFDLLCLSPSK
jgi:hypothetical protein